MAGDHARAMRRMVIPLSLLMIASKICWASTSRIFPCVTAVGLYSAMCQAKAVLKRDGSLEPSTLSLVTVWKVVNALRDI
jgi:hypothetical protein